MYSSLDLIYFIITTICTIVVAIRQADIDAWKTLNYPIGHSMAVSRKSKNLRTLVLVGSFITMCVWFMLPWVGLSAMFFHFMWYSAIWWLVFDIAYIDKRRNKYEDREISWYYMGNLDEDDAYQDMGFQFIFVLIKNRKWTLANQIYPWILQFIVKLGLLAYIISQLVKIY